VYCYLESNSLPFELADPDDVKSTDVQHDQDIHTFESTPWRQAHYMYALTEYLRPRSDRISKVTMGTPHDGTPCRQVSVMSNNTLCPGDGNVVPGDKPVRKTAIGDSFYMWQTCCSFGHQSTYHVFLSTRTNSSNSPLDVISGSMVKMPTHVVLHESLSKTVSEIGSFNNSKGYLDSEQSRTCLSYHICFDQPPESGKRTFFPKITKQKAISNCLWYISYWRNNLKKTARLNKAKWSYFKTAIGSTWLVGHACFQAAILTSHSSTPCDRLIHLKLSGS